MSLIPELGRGRQSLTLPESLLVGHIQAHIKQGDKARDRADQARAKAEQHYIAAGKYLADLKAHYPSTQQWEDLLRTKVNLSPSRASELMQLYDGRKNLEQLRADTAERVARHRAAQRPSLQGQCNEEGLQNAREILAKIHTDAVPKLAVSILDESTEDLRRKMVEEAKRKKLLGFGSTQTP